MAQNHQELLYFNCGTTRKKSTHLDQELKEESFLKNNDQQCHERHCVKSIQRRSFFESVFSCIRTENGGLRSKYPFSVRIQENTDQKKPVFGHLSRGGKYVNMYVCKYI